MRRQRTPLSDTRPMHPVWTSEDDRSLVVLRATRLTDAEIGKALGRTVAATKSRIKKLGLSSIPRPARGGKCPTWTEEEIAWLRELCSAGTSNREIAVAMKRSHQAVNSKIHDLGLAGCTRRRRRCPDEVFWSKVERAGAEECWLWTAGRAWNGYGRFQCIENGKTRRVAAHRFAYERLVGAIPAGLELLHSCDTPACVNPAHLRPGTHAENMADMVERGRHRSRGR